MKHRFKWIFSSSLVVLSLMASSCLPGADAPTRVLTVGDSYSVDSEASRGTTLLTSRKTGDGSTDVRACSFGAQIASQGSTNLTANIREIADLGADFSEQIVDLVHRSQTLGLLQEMADLLCVMMNYSGLQFPPEQVDLIFQRLLGASVDIAKTELTKAQTASKEAATKQTLAATEQARVVAARDLISAFSQTSLSTTTSNQTLKDLTRELTPQAQQQLESQIGRPLDQIIVPTLEQDSLDSLSKILELLLLPAATN